MERIKVLVSSVGYSYKYIKKIPHMYITRKLLSVGAGYNTFYELMRTGVDVRYIPVAKKYDDQVGRVERYGLAASSIPALRTWLSGGANL